MLELIRPRKPEDRTAFLKAETQDVVSRARVARELAIKLQTEGVPVAPPEQQLEQLRSREKQLLFVLRQLDPLVLELERLLHEVWFDRDVWYRTWGAWEAATGGQ